MSIPGYGADVKMKIVGYREPHIDQIIAIVHEQLRDKTEGVKVGEIVVALNKQFSPRRTTVESVVDCLIAFKEVDETFFTYGNGRIKIDWKNWFVKAALKQPVKTLPRFKNQRRS